MQHTYSLGDKVQCRYFIFNFLLSSLKKNCLHVVYCYQDSTTCSSHPLSKRAGLIQFKTCNMADHFTQSSIQGLQNEFSHLEPSQTEPVVGENRVPFFEENAILQKKSIVKIGNTFAMVPCCGRTQVHDSQHIIDFYDTVCFSALLLLTISNIQSIRRIMYSLQVL